MIGGRAIGNNNTGDSYSLGVCGTNKSTGKEGFITAGHGPVSLNQAVYRSGSQIGTCKNISYSNNANGDWAFIEKTNSDTITNQIHNNSAMPIRHVTGTEDNLWVGAVVAKYGKTSGLAIAFADKLNVTVDTGTYIIKGLTQCTISSGSSAGGDSGGPYFTMGASGGTTVNFVGVHHGVVKTDSSTIFFTPCVRFKSIFQPKTN